VLQGLPFAICGVALAVGIVIEIIASVRKNTIAAPMAVVATPILIDGSIFRLHLVAVQISHNRCPLELDLGPTG
jgi:hypothetical protein